MYKSSFKRVFYLLNCTFRFKPTFKAYSSSSRCDHLVVEKLNSRSLVRVSGTDAAEFLQGLITNDMRHFEDKLCKTIYAMMLNRQGRVLYDLLIHSYKNDEFLIECDQSVREEFQKVLKMYRLRKKVNMALVDNIHIWSVLPLSKDQGDERDSDESSKKQSSTGPILCEPMSDKTFSFDIKSFLKSSDGYSLFKDPRLSDLGYRLHLPDHVSPSDILSDVQMGESGANSYTSLRYSLGVAEGSEDIPVGASLPLESNADYLHGISFHKGCYVGQELTARTYHTGVLRKRIMPFCLTDNESLNSLPNQDSLIENENGKRLGKFRSMKQNNGLALMRIQEALKAKILKLVSVNRAINVCQPFWWPQERVKSSTS